MFGKFIDPLYFFISFAVGLFIFYIYHPKPDVVMKFPSPYNAGQIEYKDDDSQSCFKYQASKVQCPVDKTLIKAQPVG